MILFFLSFWQINTELSFATPPSKPEKIFFTPENDKYIKTVYSTQNGLPQNSINSIVQTRDGYLWLATFGGLVRFDGNTFTTFVTNDTPNLINIRISALYEDRNGVLWIGSENGDLMKYQDGKFSVVFQNPSNHRSIIKIFLDRQNRLWLLNDGATIFNPETKEAKFYETNEMLDPNSYFNSPHKDKNDFARIFAIKEAPDGSIWMASDGGLIKYQDGKFTNYFRLKGVPIDIFGNPVDFIRDFCFDKQGSIWVLSANEYGRFENGVFTPLFRFSDLPNEKRIEPSALTVDSEGNVFFVHQKSLYKVSGGNWEKFDISDVIQQNARSLLFDSEGNLWVGTDTEFVQLKSRRIQVYNFSTSNTDWTAVTAIIETPDGSVWSGMTSNLLRYKNGQFQKVSLTPESGLKVTSYITSLAVDKNETLWIGTLDGITNYKDGHFSKFDYPEEFEKNIGSLFFDKDGALWIGNKFKGVQKYQNGGFTNYNKESGLVSNLIIFITQTRDGALWIGTKEGLSRLEDGKFTNWTTANGLTNNYVREIYEDQDGNLWIGTYGGGILRYRDGNFIPITSKEGLPEDVISRILVDDLDNFWILGNRGIYSINRQKLNDFADGKIKKVTAAVYTTKDGMITDEGNGGVQYAGWKASDGKLWFPMIKGGVVINPSKSKTLPPQVHIEKVLLEDKEVDKSFALNVLPGQDNLQINYTAINFTKPEQLQFRYKVEGYDTDWQDVGTRRTAYYPYLPPGNYTFKVVAITSDGVWGENEANFSIKVSAPFWRTSLFYLLMTFVLLVFVIIFYQRQLQKLEQKRLRKEEFSRQLINAHESERQRIVSELHDGLGQNLLIIKNWAAICLDKISANSKVKQEIIDISDCATNALQEMRSITRNLRPQSLAVEGLTKTLNLMSKQIETVFKIKFQNEIDGVDNLFSEEEELSIYRIVQESLNNLVKHSGAKNAQIKVKRTNLNFIEKIEISIIDDGKGFNRTSLKKTGLGLVNIAQRTELLGGTLKIYSSPDKGTTVSVILNVEPKIYRQNKAPKSAETFQNSKISSFE